MENKLAIKTDGHTIVQDEAFIAFVKAQQELQDMIDEGWKAVKELMIREDIPGVKGKWGHITIVKNKKVYVSTGEVDDAFTKKTLDSKKIDAYVELFEGSLPTNITVKKSAPYLTKKVNV